MPVQQVSEAEYEPEKLLGMEFVRASEAAALNVFRWIGKGDKIAADRAATDALRGMLNLIDMRGTCTIGEGIKDEAPGIFVGERLGTWKDGSPCVSIAVDPIDGTKLTAKGLTGAIVVLAVARTDGPDSYALQAVPAVYMEKIAVGPKVKEGPGTVRLGAPVDQNLELIALKLGKRVRDMVVCILDRPRHEQLIADVRRTGAAYSPDRRRHVAGAIHLHADAVDVTSARRLAEAVTAAAAIKCLGGEILARMWPRDEDERKKLEADGYGEQLKKVYCTEELAKGDGIIFVATGITDNALLKGMQVKGHIARTHSLVMRAKSRTVRYVTAFHDLTRKTIHLASEARESRL